VGTQAVRAVHAAQQEHDCVSTEEVSNPDLMVYQCPTVVHAHNIHHYIDKHIKYNEYIKYINWVFHFWCSRFLYPGIVSLMVASVSFPLGLGQFMAGDLNSHDQVSDGVVYLVTGSSAGTSHGSCAERNTSHWLAKNYVLPFISFKDVISVIKVNIM
jgi:hypothetical protein